MKLTEVISAGDHEVSDIVEAVSLDQSLTAALLRRANSAMAGSRASVATVREAVVRLGSGPLLSMAFAATVGNRLDAALPAYGMVEGELWQHSVADRGGDHVPPRPHHRSDPIGAAVALAHSLIPAVVSSATPATLTLRESGNGTTGTESLAGLLQASRWTRSPSRRCSRRPSSGTWRSRRGTPAERPTASRGRR